MTDELISRQAAIDVVRRWFDKIEMNGDICIDGIISLPSAQSRYGRWIEIKNKKRVVIAIKCDQCLKFPKRGVRSDFCPNCGADMRGREEN